MSNHSISKQTLADELHINVKELVRIDRSSKFRRFKIYAKINELIDRNAKISLQDL
jgi:hypothetical protein